MMKHRLINQLLNQVEQLKEEVSCKRQAVATRAALSLPPFIRRSFTPPTPYPTPSGSFIFRMLCTNDVKEDHEAVMSSIEALTHVFAQQVSNLILYNYWLATDILRWRICRMIGRGMG
jgi:hypothetical protein